MDDISSIHDAPSAATIVTTSGGRVDLLNSEFVYFASVLKTIAGCLTNDLDKKKILPWVKKLFRPEYHSVQFREKRNKFLLHLTITLLNDEAFGIFGSLPPEGALPDIENFERDAFPPAEWELDNTWLEYLTSLTEDFPEIICSVHENAKECGDDHQLDKILDQEFKFILYLLKPYAALLPAYERTRVAGWMQTLCSISEGYCSSMRGIRNDYIMALLGYVQNLRLVGPFLEFPPTTTLPSLAEIVKYSTEPKPITDPNNSEVESFLSAQQVPDEGAFCYIVLTGDLIASAFG